MSRNKDKVQIYYVFDHKMMKQSRIISRQVIIISLFSSTS